ncbi:MAG: hypothetical protein PHQ23_15145, partial [Candidatus Wallbacteria bacterium]|nr:hypothetical protein [Candidatus Wallbacteria bacterium]
MHKLISLLILMLSIAIANAGADSRIRYLEKMSTSTYQSVSLNEFYSSLTPEEKSFLVGQIKAMLSKQLPPDFLSSVNQYLSQAGNSPYGKYLKQAEAFLTSADNSQLVSMLDTLDKDELVKIDPALFHLYHAKALSGRSASAETVEQTPAFLRTGFQPLTELKLYTTSQIPQSNLPATAFKVKMQNGGRKIGELSSVADLPDYATYNSMRLADALNQLSNAGTNGIYQKINFSFAGICAELSEPADLIDALVSCPDLELVGYESRMGVDFLGLVIEQAGTYIPLEIPSLTLTELDGRLAVPGNHSEHMLAVYQKGSDTPLALVKWYMGIPMDNTLLQGTIWKPAIYTHTSWVGFKITHHYLNDKTLKRMVEAARYIMKIYNCIQLDSNFPMNGYAVLAVCNDSTSILEAVLSGNPDLTPWPNVRSVKFDGLFQQVLSRFGTGLSLDGNSCLNVPSDAYPEHYHMESISINYLKRLVLNLPFRSKSQVKGH